MGRFCSDLLLHSSVDLGGGGGGGEADALSIRPTADPKCPLLVLFKSILFWLNDTKICVKEPLAPMYSNFKDHELKKRIFF